MPGDIPKRVLHSLFRSKHMVKKRITEEGGAADDNAIKNSDSFLFNEQFSCPMRTIRIPVPVDSHNISHSEGDLIIAVEAAIVRTRRQPQLIAAC